MPKSKKLWTITVTVTETGKSLEHANERRRTYSFYGQHLALQIFRMICNVLSKYDTHGNS